MTIRTLRLALASVLLAVGVNATPLLVPTVAPKAEAAYWCPATATSTVPTLHHLSVADGVFRELGLLATTPAGHLVEVTIWEGEQWSGCPTDVYVPWLRDIKMRCGNGNSMVFRTYRWNPIGGSGGITNSVCRANGGSIAVSFENRPDRYWG